MEWERRGRLATVLAFALLIGVPLACGGSGGKAPSLDDIPRYPNATEGESMGQSSPGGMVHGKLEQFTTTDPYDQVLEFYAEALRELEPEFMAHASELGRQAAFSMQRGSGAVTVAIQEFTQEGTVNITLMAVGG